MAASMLCIPRGWMLKKAGAWAPRKRTLPGSSSSDTGGSC